MYHDQPMRMHVCYVYLFLESALEKLRFFVSMVYCSLSECNLLLRHVMMMMKGT